MVRILRDYVGMSALWNWLGPDLIANLLTALVLAVAARLISTKKKTAAGVGSDRDVGQDGREKKSLATLAYRYLERARVETRFKKNPLTWSVA